MAGIALKNLVKTFGAYTAVSGVSLDIRDGEFLIMKGAYPEAELAVLPAGFVVVRVAPLRVPGLDAARHLVILAQRTAAPTEAE